jgi:hypothetical protein
MKHFVSSMPTALLVGLAAFAAWGEATDRDHVGAANWIVFGLATLVKEGMYLTGQTKVSLIVYLSAYTLSLAAFLGILLRQTQLPEWLLYTALLGIWAALTGWFAHAALRASSADPASR